jgi:Ala-tRNA(Pro) deacylase
MSLVTEHLAERGVAFEVVPHRRTFTSLQEARELGMAAEEVLKTVALWTGGKYVLAVVPASRRLDLRRVREALEDPDARLATEADLAADFPGYELGALPPLGSLLGVPLLVDPEVLEQELVVFAAGLETESVQVVAADLLRDEPLGVLPLTRSDGRASEEPVPSGEQDRDVRSGGQYRAVLPSTAVDRPAPECLQPAGRSRPPRPAAAVPGQGGPREGRTRAPAGRRRGRADRQPLLD